MASFTAGTTFSDGVANDVTAAKLGVLVTNATPTSGFIQDRTAETVIASNDTVLIGDASDSNNLKRITVDNLMKADMTGNINSTSGTIQTLTSSTATITSGTIGGLFNGSLNTTSGTIGTFNSTTATIPTLTSTTLITSGTGTASAPAIVPTGDTNNGLFFPAADNIAVSTNGTERVRVDSSGNVGIGTASPSVRLHVSGLGIYNAGAGNAAGIDFAGNGNTAQTNSLYVGQLTSGISAIFERGANPLTFHTNSTERLRIDSSGRVGIGTSSPASPLHVYGANGSTGEIRFQSSDGRAFIIGATGTGYGSANNLIIYDATASTERLRIDSSGNVGISQTKLGFGSTTAFANHYIRYLSANDGLEIDSYGVTSFRTNNTERLRIDSSGNVLVTSAAGLGYGTGAGGTVTQGTSKTTGVTLNKPTGQITMNNAALAANASVIFTLTNSFIANTDTLSVSHSSAGGTTSAYQIVPLTCAAGSATIRVTNITAGSLSEALVINFNVIKGSTS